MPYPFYKSLRFRFGLIFGLLFLACLLVVAVFLYKDVQQQLEKSFASTLNIQAKNILQKTDVSPTVIPLPDENEYFLLTYNNTHKTDTLYNNLPSFILHKTSETQHWRSVQRSKQFETGGIITIVYALKADDLYTALLHLKEILFIYIPVALALSFAMAYWLSGFLLKPITNIINKANKINLQNNIQLIDEPATNDELHQLVVTLNKMLSRIEKQSQQQNAFFASASHELRTPLSNMLTELQVTQLQDVSPQVQTIFHNQVTEVLRLKKLVNDFLLMSQLKAGALHINKTSAAINDVLFDCIEKIKTRAREKNQTFKIEFIPEQEEFIVIIDKMQLQIIINNLLDNATKYGNDNSVIQIIITKTSENISLKIINKTSHNIINPESLVKEFARTDFMKDGFGLGLWITDQLMQMNDKTMLLSSNQNTFCAELML